MKPHGSPSFVIGVVLLANLSLPCAQAQQILQVLEPGIGYARFKQWTVESQLVFENFTKDSLVVRDTGLRAWETTGFKHAFAVATITVEKHQILSFSSSLNQKLMW